MNLNKPAVIKKLQERFRNVNAGRGLYTAFLVPTMLTMFSTRAFAADTIWTKASAIMQDVYTQILGISTIAAVVTAAIALLLMNFSRSGRTVDESRAWLKRIVITWAILNSLGFTLALVLCCRITPTVLATRPFVSQRISPLDFSPSFSAECRTIWIASTSRRIRSSASRTNMG